MLSVDFIRQNKQKVISAAKNKNRQIDLDMVLKLDDQRRDLILQVQLLREQRNKLAKEKPTEGLREKGREIKNQLKKIEDELFSVEQNLTQLLLSVPNVVLEEVPVGDEKANKQIKKWGKQPKFDFKPKSHIELGKNLDLLNLAQGAKVSGFRGYFLKNELAILHSALMFYAFQKLVKKGFTPFIAPSIVKQFSLFGSGQLPWGEKEVYKLNDDNAYLAGTSEVAMMAYFADQIFEVQDLPSKNVAFSPCFRKEAGAYGKDTKGLYRVHEFWKVEQVVLSENNLEAAKKLHEQLEKNAEEILEELALPYRVMLMSTGETGEPQIKKYDIEVWMPSRGGYGEAMSNSIMGDFQTRRLNIKYKTKEGKTEYCYSLNNTVLASPRILIALLENNQQKDGLVVVPKVLQPLVGFAVIKPKTP